MKRARIMGMFIVAALMVIWRIEPIYMSLYSAATPATPFNERIELIENFVEWRLPEGAGPHPLVIQFHGCAGVRPAFHHQWADLANENGYAALIVNSTAPRGISRDEALQTVCNGKELVGQERAGDVMAAIEIAKQNPAVDPARIILAGWSHGAWSVMDTLTMDRRGRGPAGLTNWPRLNHRIAGTILFYPYCGLGTLSRFRPWPASAPTLALIAAEDSVVNADECIAYFDKRIAAGDKIELSIYPDTEHAFDDPFMGPDWAHWHNPDAFADAQTRYANFLRDRKGSNRLTD